MIIAGSRTILDPKLINTAIEYSGFHITEVVCGMAKGVDLLGKEWADVRSIKVGKFPANWKYPDGKHNFRAGFERNAVMGEYADALIAVWDGNSGGTLDMIKFMKKKNKQTYVYIVGGNNKPAINLFRDFDGF